MQVNMFLKPSKTETAILNNAPKKPVPSVISSELHILGNLISEGHVDIDGSVEGNVKAEQATIRPNGKVAGDVVAESVHVYGEVRGLIRATSVHLYSSCRVEGVIMHQSLTVEDGAFIDAKFKRLQEHPLHGQESPGSASSSTEEDDGEGVLESKPLLNNLRLIG
jgi:cytoskeletal protein CcmA (bactofilin family)